MAKQDINWGELGFSYMATKSFVRVQFKDGAWQKPEVLTDPMVTIHVAATALHYGQAAFEGLKVFTQKDGTISAFRPEENAKRLNGRISPGRTGWSSAGPGCRLPVHGYQRI